ncbi:MAG: hypothetical protein DWB56_10240 [Candidatus Jettenia sp.]|uniref:Uncharacterized protein n=1 Tax=Candidatus Jettenia caeni TaxID=247490 RepID=I3IL09_9BACT|nr:hypothetical protein [Candidatus Jettenia sp. AMX1]MBC6929323.1 hypothetical protein [Candidatus Jettenia sp.]NUN22729.1 hypothetical protein [Candidatus Jettenia caeni]KAA0249664.1 MAG: hypothetical protein EDM77_07920 [Candidatus Jettenia sp. AMX1]MDL1939559.1 hypothetical protein [Candidatus Jettenia sp. AMX1]GAB62404.1 hypothetical protein KSU1_C0808 [Candidatus Jettenia caeni]
MNLSWWKETVDKLWEWKAIRSQRPPNTKKEIFERGSERLLRINEIYKQIHINNNREPTIRDVSWEDIKELFRLMRDIKNTKSPVFASKLGHFLLPRVFLIIDNEATNVFNYEDLWRKLKLAWQEFNEKENAIKILTDVIKKYNAISLHPDYPFETKILELCMIGYKHITL